MQPHASAVLVLVRSAWSAHFPAPLPSRSALFKVEGEIAGTKSAKNKGHGDGAFFSQLALAAKSITAEPKETV
jgi:hypothetical protein